MGANIFIATAAFLLAMGVLASFYWKYREPTKNHCILLGLIWLVVISDALDMLLAIQARVGSQHDENTLFLLYTFYLGARQMIATLGIMHMVSYVAVTQRVRKWVKKGLIGINLYGIILLLINLLNGNMLAIDEQRQFRTHTSFLLFYLIFVVFIVFTIAFLVHNRKKIDVINKIASCFFMSVPCISFPTEYSLRTGVSGVLMTIGLLWLYLCIPRAEKRTDAVTLALNEYAFEEKLGNALKRGVPMQIMAIQFQTGEMIKEKYNEQIYHALLLEISDSLIRQVGRERVFYLTQGRFALVFPKGVNTAQERCEEILGSLQKGWIIQGKKVDEKMIAALLTIPYDVNCARDVYHRLKFLVGMPQASHTKVYDGKMLEMEHKKREKEVKEALFRAIEGDGLTVSYQPIQGVKEGRTVAAEALLRMQDEVLGEISPEEFVPIAEKEGLMVQIGNSVLEQVCRFLCENPLKDYGIEYVEVNLSTAECIEKTLPQRVGELLEKYQVDRSKLRLEVTERALVNHHEVLVENMRKLNDMGIDFSLDDYGTGYATLAYIMTLPFRVVKVDRSIFWTACENQGAMLAFCASINLLQDMNMEIVVEGVESTEMESKVKMLGCDYSQGFLYSKALPEKVFLETLQADV